MNQKLESSNWEPLEPFIPARSRLYSLEPVQIGNGQVESLASYMVRLAEAHCVWPGDLIADEMSCFLNTETPKNYLHAMSRRTEALNGIGEMALNLLHTLEAFTLRSDLVLLTLLPWSFALTTRGLMRRLKAWCPFCYEGWRAQEAVVYDPLIWSVDVIRICTIHQQELSTRCPSCNQININLSRRSIPGHCTNCQKWLGQSKFLHLKAGTDDALIKQQIWITRQIEDLLINSPEALEHGKQNSLPIALSACISDKTEGNIAAFARLLDMPKNTVWGWCKGKALPELAALLKICHLMQVSLPQLLLKPEELITKIHPQDAVHFGPILDRPQRVASELDEASVGQSLLSTMEEEPPPSMQTVARRLNIPIRTLRRRFPETCRQLSSRYINHRDAVKAEKVRTACAEVRDAAFALYQEGVEPTRSRITRRLSKPAYFREQSVVDALQSVRQELGLEPK